MKTTKLILTGIGLILYLALFPNTASGRVSFYMGVGIGSRYHHHGGSHYGLHVGHSYRPHGGYHRRYDGGYYKRYHIDKHRQYHHYRPWYRSGVSLRVDGYSPMIVRSPVVIEIPKVVTERRVIVEEPEYYEDSEYNDDTAELFEEIRRKKSELLKKLKIGDKDKSIEAIQELAGFSFDNEVRQALEDVLLSDPDTELRIEVAKALGKTTNKKVLPALQNAKVYDPSMEVRLEAHKAILKIKGYRL
ncbi:MAG: HEAT repeat domain-containing protein [Planctomycetes bacterium]|nr:HEAT repeat domain-containing protein [Planctomycetota bacterium]